MTRYHDGCVRGGVYSFIICLFANTNGLKYPSQHTSFPFIYDGCTVRVFLKRELFVCPKYLHLLKLERMRMIDMAHAWSHGTHIALMCYLRLLANLSDTYGVSTLLDTPLLRPPSGPMIPNLWTVSDYTLQKSKRTKNNINYNSVMVLLSEAAAFNSWTLALAHPDTMYISSDNLI
jgi:hypothetical protein